jgi:ribonuclease Z
LRVTLLGTGTPGPNPNRHQSAVLVEIGRDVLLFDAGRGAVDQMACVGTGIDRVDPVFITHHHFDHISDLFDVIITTALCGRTHPLRIFGPAGTTRIVRALLEQVYDRDIRSRIEETNSQRRMGFPTSAQPEVIAQVQCHDVEPGVICETERWRVVADRVHHGDFTPEPDFDWRCLGYRLEAEGKVVTISGDTVPCDGIVRLASEADLLIQCCHFLESSVTDDAGRYFTKHTLPSSGQVGRIAAQAKVRHLVLTHIGLRISGADMLDELRRDVRRDFDGEVTVGEDLLRIEL